jgi:nucleoside-diphosphate-sugar epimerase
MALLHECRHKFSYEKARRLMGYEPLVSVSEGIRRAIEWLGFIGYPLHDLNG